MKDRIRMIRKAVAAAAFLLVSSSCMAAEAVYRIVEYNKTTGEFTLAASGMVPKGAWAYFENEYGATTGNRYNQIPRNRKATLYLEGWQGCKLKSVTLSMCSNNKSGQVGLAVADGDTQLYQQRPVDFASTEWFGAWVSKDLNAYVDITKQIDATAFNTGEASITLQGGTAEGSVYIGTITLEYDEPAGTPLVSPMGWSYEKLSKKSVLADGDEVMIYRNSFAADDLGGMEEAHYLDAVAVASTADVADHDVLRFTLGKAEGQDLWTMTDQYGRLLGADGKQSLAWDGGSTQWTITPGYDGTEITNAATQYGTLRFNVPSESYARFNVYTSTSLPLPFLYRKTKQLEPVAATSPSFGEPSVTASLADGCIALHPELSPKTTTDRRISWTSSNEAVATVNGGFVTLLSEGQTTITATAKSGGATASVSLNVTSATGIGSATNVSAPVNATYKVVNGNGISIKTANSTWSIDGKEQK